MRPPARTADVEAATTGGGHAHRWAPADPAPRRTDDGTPERFEPAQMRGELVAAEHLVRYHWALPLVRGAHVLDAGCGAAYGAALLAEAASSVVGVDIADAVLESARPGMPGNVELVTADLHSLPQPDGTFDVVVCFEAIEHVPDPEPVLDELRRVLRPGGLLVLSTPNRDHYPAGNAHHHFEFTPAELSVALTSRFEYVRLHRQHDYIASAIFDDDAFAQDSGLVELPAAVKVVSGIPGAETYTLALASDGSLPDAANAAAFTGDVEVRRWLDIYQQQQAVLHQQLLHINDLQARLRGHDELGRRLAEVEAELAAPPRLLAAEAELERLRHDLGMARTTVADILGSTSWRVAAPVRWLGQWRGRRRRGGGTAYPDEPR